MAEFAVGYRNLKNFGAPFPPMLQAEAELALSILKKSWPDAILVTRDEPSSHWQEVPTPERGITPVASLYDRWVKAGPPPLGVSLSRWWDSRLVELHRAIVETEDRKGRND